jgi:hypothetical protein
MPDKPKAYRVANPRGIPEGMRILRTDTREWFEGDEIAPGGDLSDQAFAAFIARGFVVEVEEPRPRRSARAESAPESAPPTEEVSRAD